MVNQELNKTIIETHENVTQYYLPRRLPLIIRCDGRSFQSLTSGFKKPFDMIFIKSMHDMGIHMSKQLQGCKLSYSFSDEISFLITDYDKIDTNPWYNRNLLKTVSVTAGLVSVQFNKYLLMNTKNWWNKLTDQEKSENKELYEMYNKKLFLGVFDCKAFTLPPADVNKYFIERQKYAILNFSQLVPSEKKNSYDSFLQRGVTIVRNYNEETKASGNNWIVDYNVPFFTKDLKYIENVARLGDYNE